MIDYRLFPRKYSNFDCIPQLFITNRHHPCDVDFYRTRPYDCRKCLLIVFCPVVGTRQRARLP